jgi:hypothetical protein
VIVTHALDYETSIRLNGQPGICEINPIYRDPNTCQFRVVTGTVGKIGVPIVGMFAERYAIRKWPRTKLLFTLGNFAFAAGTAPAIWGNRKLRH